MISFEAFADELTKIAGFELELRGYPGGTAKKIRRVEKLERKLQGTSYDDEQHAEEWNKKDDLDDQIRYDDRVGTPFDSKAGPKMTTWSVLEAAGKARKWDPGYQTKNPDEDEITNGPMLSMTRLQALKKDYTAGLRNPNRYMGPKPSSRDLPVRPGQILPHEQAFLDQVDHLVKDPKVSFGRLEYH